MLLIKTPTRSDKIFLSLSCHNIRIICRSALPQINIQPPAAVDESNQKESSSQGINQATVAVTATDKGKKSAKSNSYGIVLIQVISYVITGIITFITVRLQNETAIWIFKIILQMCYKFNIFVIPLIWVESHEPVKKHAIKRINGFMAMLSLSYD